MRTFGLLLLVASLAAAQPLWVQRGASYSGPAARNEHTMAYDAARGRTILFGGQGASGPLAATWEWDGMIWTQRFAGTSPAARVGHAVAYDSTRGRVVLFGGFGSNTTMGDTWEWDGTACVTSTPILTHPCAGWLDPPGAGLV